MKLIVLYGPENSGKTTILKMVYEQVKKKNLVETHWFKYYDDNCEHNDFRDVLVIEDDKVIETKPLILSNFEDEVKKIIEDLKSQDYKIEVIPKDENGNKMETITEKLQIHNDDDTFTDFNDVSFEQFIKIDKTKLQENQEKQILDFIRLLCREPENYPTSISGFDGKTVGFITEGDFGFIAPSTSWWAKHHQNLYTHLKNLEECDVIICACSLLHKKTVFQQPLLCLVQFIYECFIKGSLTGLCRKYAPYPLPNSWPSRMRSNQPIVDWIISHI